MGAAAGIAFDTAAASSKAKITARERNSYGRDRRGTGAAIGNITFVAVDSYYLSPAARSGTLASRRTGNVGRGVGGGNARERGGGRAGTRHTAGPGIGRQRGTGKTKQADD